MWVRKNVAGPERWARVVGGLLLIACGLFGMQASLLGVLTACVGAVSVLTAVVGHCPACALAGRKPLSER